MSRLAVTSLVAAACIVTGQAPKPVSAGEDALRVCRAHAPSYERAVGSGDPAQVAALFTTDGTLNAPEAIVRGREAITAFERAFVVPGIAQTVTPSQGERMGARVICSGRYTVTFAPGFPMKQVAGNYAAILVEEDGRWLHALLAYSYAPPPAPAAGQ